MTSVEELIRTFSPAPEADAIETAHIAAARAALDREIAGKAGIGVRHRGRASRIARPLRFIPLAVGCLVAVAIVAVALAVIRHHAARGPSLTGPAAGPAANALISRLAVLRRPQTAADQLPGHLVVNRTPKGVVAPGRAQLGVIIPSLTRLVATRPDAKLYLAVTTPTPGPQGLWRPSQGDQVAILAITSRGATQSAGYPAAELSDSSQLIRAGLIIAPGDSANARAAAVRQAYDVSIVPDGIAQVRWTFANRAGGRGRIITAPAVNNVAITPLSQTTAFLLRATWYAPDGSVVPTSATALDQATAARQATDRRHALAQAERQHANAPAQLLNAFAVFSFDSPTGTPTADGYVIAHRPLPQLPLDLLNGFGPYPLDLRQTRSVRAPSGLEMWVIPGSNGLCVFETDDQTTLPYGRLGHGSGGSCSNNLQSAIATGAGLDAANQHGAVVYGVVPRTVHSVKVHVSRSSTRTIHPSAGVYITQTPFHFG